MEEVLFNEYKSGMGGFYRSFGVGRCFFRVCGMHIKRDWRFCSDRSETVTRLIQAMLWRWKKMQ